MYFLKMYCHLLKYCKISFYKNVVKLVRYSKLYGEQNRSL